MLSTGYTLETELSTDLGNIRISSVRFGFDGNIPIGSALQSSGANRERRERRACWQSQLDNRERDERAPRRSLYFIHSYLRGEIVAGNEFRMSVYVSDYAGAITDENAREIARSLPCLGSGVSRSVYDLGDVVLKIDDGGNYAGNCASEVACWEEFKGTEHEHLFARIHAYGRGWIIAEKASPDYTLYRSQEGADVRAQLEWLGIGDLHDGNLGFREDGSGCAIDYAFNEHRHAVCSDAISSACECCECDCKRCWPNGCDCCCSLHCGECASGEGCQAPECSDCFRKAIGTGWESGGTWFGFRYGILTNVWADGQYIGAVRSLERLHFCSDHAPKAVTPKPEIIGQRGLRIHNGEFLLPWEPAH